jgi:aryl-alcohol dehydrogenase-like predicted oxidoreductase/enamine deaminase RidA (YjgF/YER057c/UK114 family)
MSAVERVVLAPGLEISRVVTGLWQIADMERDGRSLDEAAAMNAMQAHADAGLTTFDMADHYGSAEELAGRFAARESGRVELLTKWVPEPGPLSRADVRAAVERALRRLRADRIELLQFHAWRWSDPAWLDALFELQELKRAGLIGHLGVTNFDTAHLRVALTSGVEVVSNQVCFSLLDTRPRARMLELCAAHGARLLAYGSVAGGFLTERWLGVPRPDREGLTWSQMKYLRFIDVTGGWDALQSLLRVVHGVARKYRVSMANVAGRWVLDHPGVAGIIIGARLGESTHIEDNVRLFALRLDDSDRAALNEAVARLETVPGDCGDEYRRPPYLTAAGDLSHHFAAMPAPYEATAGAGGRTRVLTGTVWERLGGFSRAVRAGRRIVVSGTTATHGDRVIGGSDPIAQAHFIIDKIEGAIQSLGGRLEDVIRTRVYIRHMEDWEAVTRVHGERFAHVRPANTLVQANIIGDAYRVEMEAEAEAG